LIEADPKEFRLDPRQRFVFRRELAEAQERLTYVEHLVDRIAGARRQGAGAGRRREMAS
jgi:hypothetical protein